MNFYDNLLLKCKTAVRHGIQLMKY